MGVVAVVREWLRLIGKACAECPAPLHHPAARIHFYESDARATVNRRASDREEAPSAGQHAR